jgi:hypothetical protein
MAKIKAFTDASGVTHSQAVWLPNRVEIVNSIQAARIVFEGWHNLAALATGKAPIPGASREYVVSGSTYLALVGAAPSDQPTTLDVVAQAIYDYAATVLDTPSVDDPEVMVSYFHGCEDVTI